MTAAETWLDKLRAIVRSMLTRRATMTGVDLLGMYRAKVVAQSSDMLSLDVQPDDTRIPGMSGIPLRLTPGLRCKVAAGKFVLVGWDGGDPSKPYATPAWDAAGTTVEIHVDGGDIILNGGTLKVAREHDGLNVGTLSGMSPAGPVNLTYIPGGYPAPGAPQAGPSVNLGGIVKDGEGAAHVKA